MQTAWNACNTLALSIDVEASILEISHLARPITY